MSLQPVSMRLVLDAQIVSFHPKTAIEKQQHILATLNTALKKCGAEVTFIVGDVKLIIERENP
jgi:hypothetical protein